MRSLRSLVLLALAMTTLLGLVAVPARAAGAWEHQTPNPTTSNAEGIDMVSATEGWIADVSGQVFHTVDGGVSWTRQTVPANEDLNAVRFLDSQHGWAASSSSLYYTTDGGQTWRKASGTAATNYGIDFADTSRGWAVGIGGIVFRSTDGGKTWSWSSTPTGQNLKDVDFVDASNGWAVGGSGAIIHTTNGGASWSKQTSGTTAFLDGVSFASAQEGWAAGGDTILHTTNGGATWTKQTFPAGTWVYGLKFVDAKNGWAAGEAQDIVHTSDGGATWLKQYVAAPTGPHGRLWGIGFADATHGVAVGEASILSTADGGSTWTWRINGSAAEVFGLDMTDASHLWASQYNGAVSRTIDGGMTWTTVYPGNQYGSLSGVSFHAVDFVDNKTGWIGGDIGSPDYNGVIMKSTDGGATWVQQRLDVSALSQVYGLAAANRNTVVAVGNFGVIVRSTDGGATWTSIPNPSSSLVLNDIRFYGKTGWIAGNGGVIMRSTDAGLTWREVFHSPTNEALMSVSFAPDRMNGWVVGFTEAWHTSNGGRTWTQQFPWTPSFTNLLSASAISATTAWITGTSGYVGFTTDGGATWTDVSPSPGSLNSFSSSRFLSADEGWAAGSAIPPDGGIWHHTAA